MIADIGKQAAFKFIARLFGDVVNGPAKGDTTVKCALRAFDNLNTLGIDQAQVCAELEAAGVASFADSWQDLLDSVDQRLRDLK